MKLRQAHYLEAIIDGKFFDKSDSPFDENGFNNIFYSFDSKSAYLNLHQFLNHKFTSNTFRMPPQHNKAFLISSETDNIIKAQNFLIYLFENKDLESSVKEHINNSSFEDFLEKVYDSFQLEQELCINNSNKKKPKL